MTVSLFIAVTAAFATTTRWTGQYSSEWTNTQNWDNGIPSVTVNAVIPALANDVYPVISGEVVCNELIIEQNAILTMSAKGILKISGNFINDGSFMHNDGTVSFEGVSSVSGTSTTVFHHIIIKGMFAGNMKGSFSVDGNFTNNGTFVAHGGTINFTGNTSISGTSVSSFSNISITGIITGHSQSMNVLGTWSNNGTFKHNKGTVTFNGTANQSIGGAFATVFYNLDIDNKGNGVTFDNSQTVENKLVLTNGYCNLFTNTLTVNNSEQNAISRKNGYIISETVPVSGYSNLKWKTANGTGTFVIPFGTNDGQYIPMMLTIATAGVGNGIIQIATYSTDEMNEPYPAGVINMNDEQGKSIGSLAVNRFWLISTEGYNTDPVVSLTFTATKSETGNNKELAAFQWKNSFWSSPVSEQSHTENSASVSGISSFGQWTVAGNEITVTSPVQTLVTKFTAEKGNNNSILLKWTTSSESDLNNYIVERSNDAASFTGFTTVTAKGNSVTASDYSITDDAPFSGISYYRLKMSNNDGSFTYSETRTVNVDEHNLTVQNGSLLFPNPFSAEDMITVTLSGTEEKEVSFFLYDLNGKKLLSETINLVNGNSYNIKLNDIYYLSAGMYFVRLTGAGEKMIANQKLVVTK